MKERLLFLICFLCISFMLKAADKPVIKISTENVDLIYRVGDNGRLYQSYLGKRLNHATDIAHLPQGSEAYLTHGMEDYFEPAIHIVHNDGNPSTLLKYVSHTRKSPRSRGGILTTGRCSAGRQTTACLWPPCRAVRSGSTTFATMSSL